MCAEGIMIDFLFLVFCSRQEFINSDDYELHFALIG